MCSFFITLHAEESDRVILRSKMRNEIVFSILAMVTVQIFTAKAAVQADTTAEDLLPSNSKQQQLLTRHTKAAEDPRSVSPRDVLCGGVVPKWDWPYSLHNHILGLGGHGCCNHLGAACCSNGLTVVPLAWHVAPMA